MTQSYCRWDHPGAAPYGAGPIDAAIDALTEIPPGPRARLKRDALEGIRYARFVATRESIAMTDGRPLVRLRNVNFRGGRICAGLVDRQGWAPGETQRGDVYRAAGWYVVRFDSCGNWAQVDNAADTPAMYPVAASGLLARNAGVHSVPEPGSLALAVLAAAGLWVVRRRAVASFDKGL